MDGAPVAGATVHLASTASAGTPSKTTDANGHFDFGPEPASEYVVAAEVPHVTGAVETIDLRDSELVPPPDQLRLVLHPCTASIHGTVSDASHVAIASARISRGDGDSGVATDASGHYELCVPENTSEVSVRASGYAYVEERVTAFGPVRRDFTLVPEAPVEGHVVRAGDRAPVDDALVELKPDLGGTAPTLHVRTDPEGRFHFEGAAPGRHKIAASADHLATVRPVIVIAVVGMPDEQVTCVVEPVSIVEGTVVDRASRAPLGGVKILLKRTTVNAGSSSPLDQPWLSVDATSRNDGSFTFERVPAGGYTAIAMRSGMRSDKTSPSFAIDRSDITGVVVELDGGASITGHVLRAGKPVDGADVSTDRAHAVSGADGRFVLSGLEPGKHAVYAESQRDGAFTHGPTVTVAKGEQRDGVDVELDLSGSISGRVIDQDGSPVGGAMLRFSLLHTTDFGVATTADDGTFVARALSGGGTYVYEVISESSGIAYRPLVGKRFPAIAVRDGNDHVTGVTVRVRHDHLAIAGRVTTSEGQPVPDVAITATDLGAVPELGPSSSRANTDASGAFALTDLAAGQYTITARSPDGAEVEQQATAGSGNLVLQLEDVGEIDGTLEGFDDVSDVFASHTGNNAWYTAAITGTAFRVRNVPPGTYRVSAYSATATGSTTVTVTAGATANVVVLRRPAGTIVGSLVDGQTSAPIANGQCLANPVGGTDDADGFRSATTGPDGSFRMTRVATGDVAVGCYTEGTLASGMVHVVADETVRLDLVAQPDNRRPGYAGVTFENQLGELMVQSVVPGGPADRAGLAVGDIVVKMDGQPATGFAATSFGAFPWPVGTPVPIIVERGDTEMTVQVVPEAAP
jgi:S1-C subfamily serine protease